MGMTVGLLPMIRVIVIVGTVIPGMLMSMLVFLPSVGVRVAMLMTVLMDMGVVVSMAVLLAIVIVRVLMSMRVFMLVLMVVVVFAFHSFTLLHH